MKASKQIVSVILVLILGSMACNLPSNQIDPNEAAALTLTAGAQTLQASTPVATNTAVPTNTEIPIIPTNTVPPVVLPTTVLQTATPSGTFFVVDVGANCRKGPGTVYDKTGSFAAGTYITIVGHNADNSWWLVLSGSSNCWISGSTGHTTGNLSGIPLVEAPPTPTTAPSAGPTLTDPLVLVSEVSYPGNCTSSALKVAIHVTDAGKGIKSVWLAYRYLGDGGYTGTWHKVSPNDNAAGGIYGFNYSLVTEAAGELGTQNGTIQYQFFATDNSDNQSSYPSSSALSMPIKYCP
ncbi:MAG: SH3 domain-containing protein [Anaerolineales bacterium]